MNSFDYVPASTPTLTYTDSVNIALRTRDLNIRQYTKGYYTSFKKPVRAATTEQIQLIGLQVIDGVSLQEYDRILVKDQPDEVESGLRYSNGIYVVRTTNWDRADDCLVGTPADGLMTYVISGNINSKKFFYSLTTEGTIGSIYITFLSLAQLQQPVGDFGDIQYNDQGHFNGSDSLKYTRDSTIDLSIGTIGHVNVIESTAVRSQLVGFNISSGDGSNPGNGGNFSIITGTTDANTSGNITIISGDNSVYENGNINIEADSTINISPGTSNLSDASNVIFFTGSTNSTSVDSGIFMNTTSGVSILTTDINTFTAQIDLIGDHINLPTDSTTNTGPTATLDYPQGFITIDTNGLGGIAPSSITTIQVSNKYILADSIILANVQSYTGTGSPTVYVEAITYVADYDPGNSFDLVIANVNTTDPVDTDVTVGFVIL